MSGVGLSVAIVVLLFRRRRFLFSLSSIGLTRLLRVFAIALFERANNLVSQSMDGLDKGGCGDGSVHQKFSRGGSLCGGHL